MTDKPTYEELEQRVREFERADYDRNHAEETLQASESRFRLMFMNAPLPYQSLDEYGNFLDVNEPFLKVLGYTREEVIGRNFGEFLHPDWIDHFKENFPRFKAVGEVLGVEFDMVKKDGSTILVSFNGKIQQDDQGRFRCTHCIFNDITDRKRAEEALRHSEEFLRQVIDASPNCIFIKDWDGRYVLVNKAIAKLYGVSKEEMLGRTDSDLAGTGSLDPEEAETFLADDQDVIKRKTLKRISEECLTRGDGTQTWFYTIKVPLSSDLMPNCMLGVATDITERKQAGEALEAQRAQLKSLFDYSGEAIVLLDIENHILEANSGFERIFGYSLGEAQGKIIEDLICPERFRYTESKEFDEQALKGIRGVEIIRKRKDGEEIDVRVSAGPIKIGDNVTGRFVVFDDITERKRMEEALWETSENLRAILENSPLLISEFDAEGRYIRVNRAVTNLFKRAPSELGMCQ